ncbi:6-phosphogluconolactonase [Haloactinopolyspora alba]|uniref:6-phosphogluconolactonase n=1 Tax=Haloactinopolyspora alba TaxID=648780 RepID=A0A2P8E3K7_9ACTN|nr:6-phosphogluconolactonase [Haloactinopolyspora alba]PSL04044.1 6-phosphogluconolactonase [Haloactinopolyspora alba]
MSEHSTVVIHRDSGVLADAVAARLITSLVDAQAHQGHASVVLTGGSVGIATLRAVAASPARAAVDWSAVDVWWGDERFLPPGDPERNETQAREALLDHVPVDEARVHPMPAEGSGSPEEGAERYAATLADYVRAHQHTGAATFDVLLLGVGPDGHVASLFPEQPALDDERPVVAVHGAPKPPPTRISLGLSAIGAADEVWLVVAGEDKAPAVRMARAEAGSTRIPASGVRGHRATRWLLDRSAAAELPDQHRHASP